MNALVWQRRQGANAIITFFDIFLGEKIGYFPEAGF
jgi:hypothetical protein